MSDQPKTSPDPLPGDDWETRLTKQVARTVNHYRRASGLTTKAFASLCNIAARDGDLTEVRPTTLNNLFAGKRKSIGLAEVILFARVLGVPPVALITSVGVEDASEAWPASGKPADVAFDAIVGYETWGSTFDEAFASVIKSGNIAKTDLVNPETFSSRARERARRITKLLLAHGRQKAQLMENVWMFAQEMRALSDVDLAALTSVVRSRASELQVLRRSLRDDGLSPAELMPPLSWVDVADVDALSDSDIRGLIERSLRDAAERSRIVVMESSDGAAADADQ